MGRLSPKVFLDSCMVIYLVEQREQYASILNQKMHNLASHSFCISSLIKMECLVEPFKHNNMLLKDRFLEFFAQCETLPLSEDIFLRAAELRAKYKIKAIDALHLATVDVYQCNEFWTNDQQLYKINPTQVRNIFD